jgi:hypothetical protein
MNLETIDERREVGEFLPHMWICPVCGNQRDDLRDTLLGVLNKVDSKLLSDRYRRRSQYNSSRVGENKPPHGTWGKKRKKHVIQKPQNVI